MTDQGRNDPMITVWPANAWLVSELVKAAEEDITGTTSRSIKSSF